MRELVERSVEDGHVIRHAPARKTGRRVQVNDAESPLAWLRARGMVDARQFEAGERLRGDYEMAALGARVTMRWDPAPGHRQRGTAGAGLDPTMAQIAAKRRFDAAIAAGGRGLSDILWRVICAGKRSPWRKRRWVGRCGRGGWC